ncbi:MAG: HAD family hydrolase [Planctomycetes bacterium]|nr:HAD family hydrolase [Planctomycetota bacterium]
MVDAPAGRPAVFLDRDGVLNNTRCIDGVSHPPASVEDLRILPGVPQAVARLKAAGFLCVCVSNQPDIARGRRTIDNVRAMNDTVRREVPLDDLLFCPHDTADGCACRKPRPGMLLAAAEQWRINLAASWMVGDRLSDVEAGKRAGCRTVLIAPDSDTDTRSGADLVCRDLAEAAEGILAAGEGSRSG